MDRNLEEISKRLKYAVNEVLFADNKFNKQEEIAEELGVADTTFSSAVNGNQRYLTENMVRRFCERFNYDFDYIWTGKVAPESKNDAKGLVQNNNGHHVIGIENNNQCFDVLLQIVEKHFNTTSKFQEQIDRLITIIERR